uniref:Ig-like domain-containing protein n=1 Tax=Lepisosteus oculatus TaxID=7918 RepID=W5LXP1_LEPOC
MRILPVLLLSVFFLKYVRSDVVFTQSGPEIKKPGESFKISCKASGYTYTDYNINWIRQSPVKGFEWLGYITSRYSTGYADAVKGKMTFTRDNSNSMAYLQMSNPTSEDTAVYYCARYAQ